MRQCLFAVLPLLVAACSQAQTSAPLPGSDRDSHGCIGSAGYSWCERTKQCERPWELAQSRGFENTAEAYRSFCD
ncbi:hypothetical protein XW59_006570 [Aquamicrobium sp. LC103]|nr:hypothetical protein XW59_006570 [Aquamicrobium sp. LC103]